MLSRDGKGSPELRGGRKPPPVQTKDPHSPSTTGAPAIGQNPPQNSPMQEQASPVAEMMAEMMSERSLPAMKTLDLLAGPPSANYTNLAPSPSSLSTGALFAMQAGEASLAPSGGVGMGGGGMGMGGGGGGMKGHKKASASVHPHKMLEQLRVDGVRCRPTRSRRRCPSAWRTTRTIRSACASIAGSTRLGARGGRARAASTSRSSSSRRTRRRQHQRHRRQLRPPATRSPLRYHSP